MRVHHSLDGTIRGETAGGSLAIGNFDGVHLGHQRIIARAREAARPAVAMTFEPHPLAVLSPRQALPPMTPIDEKVRLLGEAGADVVVVAPTDRALLELGPEEFVGKVVVGVFAPRAVVEGRDFGFGRGRSGDVETLQQLGRRFGFEVHVVEPVVQMLPGHHEPAAVSSTLIRRLIGGGSVEAAGECLGRPYRLIGRVIPGRGRGRQLGFPTVNLDTGAQLLPAEAVYAGLARCRGHGGPAAIVVGPAPTFDDSQAQQVGIEAYLLDFAGDLRGEKVELDFLRRLRSIERFDSVADLIAQIQRDVDQVRELAAGTARPRK